WHGDGPGGRHLAVVDGRRVPAVITVADLIGASLAPAAPVESEEVIFVLLFLPGGRLILLGKRLPAHGLRHRPAADSQDQNACSGDKPLLHWIRSFRMISAPRPKDGWMSVRA